jgi:hypothetical protein
LYFTLERKGPVFCWKKEEEARRDEPHYLEAGEKPPDLLGDGRKRSRSGGRWRG